MTDDRTVKVTQKELRNRIESAFDTADAARVRGLERMSAVRNARARALERGIARRVARAGEDDPSVQHAARRMKRNRVAAEELEPLRIAAAHALTEVDPSMATIQGAVLDERNRGIRRAAVTLVGPRGEPLRGAPKAATGDDGYFELHVPPKFLESVVYVAVGSGPERRVLEEAPLKLQPGEARFVVGRPAGVERVVHIDAEPPVGPGDQPGDERRATLEDIEGIGRALADRLRAAGIKDLEAVVGTPTDRLSEILGPRVNAANVKRSAAEILRKEHERRRGPGP